MRLLAEDEGKAVGIVNRSGQSDILLVCEHASRRIPRTLGTLGLDPVALEAHIAWDPGALAVAERLSAQLDATLVKQNFSRLVYDCNRPPHSPDAMPVVSEVYEIAANRALGDEERQARIDEIYRPFQSALAEVIASRIQAGQGTVLVTIHSFTPVYKGVQRAVEIGILHDRDQRMADRMLELAEDDKSYLTRRNEPYGPADGVTHTLCEHGLANNLPNVMIEIRNDLIADEKGQEQAADYVQSLLERSLAAIRVENRG